MYDIQSRWKLEDSALQYYGLRNQPNLFKNSIKLSNRQTQIVSRLPCTLTQAEMDTLGSLMGVQIVEAAHKRKIPLSLEEAKFCKTCAANDFIIPGIEFDTDGKCPICQSVSQTKNLRSVVPVMNSFPKSKKSQFTEPFQI